MNESRMLWWIAGGIALFLVLKWILSRDTKEGAEHRIGFAQVPTVLPPA